jgi:hypothetical protein
MSDDPTNNGDFWKYEVDTVQRHGTTAATKARRHGEVSRPNATDGNDPNDNHEADNGGFDRDVIPTGI